MNQSLITCSRREARENASKQVKIRFGLLLIGWKARVFFFQPSCSVVQAKSITFQHSNENRSKRLFYKSLPKTRILVLMQRKMCKIWQDRKHLFKPWNISNFVVYITLVLPSLKLCFSGSNSWRSIVQSLLFPDKVFPRKSTLYLNTKPNWLITKQQLLIHIYCNMITNVSVEVKASERSVFNRVSLL